MRSSPEYQTVKDQATNELFRTILKKHEALKSVLHLLVQFKVVYAVGTRFGAVTWVAKTREEYGE